MQSQRQAGLTPFTKAYQPVNPGRTPTKFLRKRLDGGLCSVPSADEFRKAARLADDTSIREALVDRLLQIAFTDKVIVVGYDRKAEEPIERVSSAECIKAIELLQKYDMGSAPKGANSLEVADHLRSVEKDRVSTIIACLGSKLRSLSPTEMRDFFETCANDPEKFMSRAEQLLEGASGSDAEVAAEGRINASPKGCDTASHAPPSTATPTSSPEQAQLPGPEGSGNG